MRFRSGQVTLESAVVLPGFLLGILALSSLIGYPIRCHRIAQAMADSARELSMATYLFSLTGGLALEANLEEMAETGVVLGGKQLDEIEGVLESLSIPNVGAGPVEGTLRTFRQMSRSLTSEAGGTAVGWMQEGFAALSCELVTNRLSMNQAQKAVDGGKPGDPWLVLGVDGGKAGVDFSQSKYSGKTGDLVLVACYRLRPTTMFGLSPSLSCRSKVRMRLWGSGKGKALRVNPLFPEESETGPGAGESLWNHTNAAAFSWNRGRIIEQKELERLASQIQEGGNWFVEAKSMQAGFDAMSGTTDSAGVVLWQVTSLNPFLASYRENERAVRQILVHQLNAMPDATEEVPHPADGTVRRVLNRRLVLVVPVNAPAWVDQLATSLRMEFATRHAVLEVVRGYGPYEETVQASE